MPNKPFIDTHCHLFNMVDVPFYETAMGYVNMASLLILFGSLTRRLDEVIENYRDAVRFFEREIEVNIEWFSKQLRETVDEHQNDTDIIVCTPLIMDFDCAIARAYQKRSYKAPHIGRDVSVLEQYLRLKNAITKSKTHLDGRVPVKVFPFIGFDLAKLEDTSQDALGDLKAFWKKYKAKKRTNAADWTTWESGRVLGIKLYPPLGFNPYPEDQTLWNIYKPFFEWCTQQQIPITVHCQPFSFTLSQKNKEINRDTTPENWYAMLKDNASLKELRINFAHFGGVKELPKAFKGRQHGRMNADSWSTPLVKLLQEFPNTYSDVSAYKFVSHNARLNFRKVLKFDARGTLGDGVPSPKKRPLADKLLWGSDVPMIISGEGYYPGGDKKKIPHYKYYVNKFLRTVNKADGLNPTQKKTYRENILRNNPRNFLFKTD